MTRGKRTRLLEAEHHYRLLRAKRRPVLPEQRWDYSRPYKLPGER